MEPRTIQVDLGERSYDILVGTGTLDASASYRGLPRTGRAVVVTNETLAPLYGDRLRDRLRDDGADVQIIVLPDGEEHKVWSSVQAVLDAMLSTRCDRKTVVHALGGGVIGDIAGFAAACYMRGVRYVQIPTTLLAQVDSSVGGKTGINHPAGKNLIGAFHQPSRVVIDLDLLDSLPSRQFLAGLAEVIKYGVACDDEFLAWIEGNLQSLLRRDKAVLLEAVGRSCEIKARVVASDEHESGPRAVLNFGHTFAHAIEAGMGYGTWLHGEAVAAGMVLAADLSARLGSVRPVLVERLVALLDRAGLPSRAPALGTPRYLALMRADKKNEGSRLRFVLLQGPGRAVLRPVDEAEVARTLEARASGPAPRVEN